MNETERLVINLSAATEERRAAEGVVWDPANAGWLDRQARFRKACKAEREAISTVIAHGDKLRGT